MDRNKLIYFYLTLSGNLLEIRNDFLENQNI